MSNHHDNYTNTNNNNTSSTKILNTLSPASKSNTGNSKKEAIKALNALRDGMGTGSGSGDNVMTTTANTKDRINNTSTDENDQTVEKYESIKLGKHTMKVRRVYLLYGNYRVGWIKDVDINSCMDCLSPFGYFRRKHHCRACGNVFCSNCSPHTVRIETLNEPGGSRICNACIKREDTKDLFSLISNTEDDGNTDGGSSDLNSTSEVLGISGSGSPIEQDLLKKQIQNTSKAQFSARKFESLQTPKYSRAFRVMRRIIPPNIFSTDLPTLLNTGLPKSVAERVWNNKSLWLICMHSEDILKIHIGDLRSKYSPIRLDIVEMRAIWHVLPVFPEEDKNSWKESFKQQLDSMAVKESVGQLAPDLLRNPAYSGHEPIRIFDPHQLARRRYAPAPVTPEPPLSPDDPDSNNVTPTPADANIGSSSVYMYLVSPTSPLTKYTAAQNGSNNANNSMKKTKSVYKAQFMSTLLRRQSKKQIVKEKIRYRSFDSIAPKAPRNPTFTDPFEGIHGSEVGIIFTMIDPATSKPLLTEEQTWELKIKNFFKFDDEKTSGSNSNSNSNTASGNSSFQESVAKSKSKSSENLYKSGAELINPVEKLSPPKPLGTDVVQRKSSFKTSTVPKSNNRVSLSDQVEERKAVSFKQCFSDSFGAEKLDETETTDVDVDQWSDEDEFVDEDDDKGNGDNVVSSPSLKTRKPFSTFSKSFRAEEEYNEDKINRSVIERLSDLNTSDRLSPSGEPVALSPISRKSSRRNIVRQKSNAYAESTENFDSSQNAATNGDSHGAVTPKSSFAGNNSTSTNAAPLSQSKSVVNLLSEMRLASNEKNSRASSSHGNEDSVELSFVDQLNDCILKGEYEKVKNLLTNASPEQHQITENDRLKIFESVISRYNSMIKSMTFSDFDQILGHLLQHRYHEKDSIIGKYSRNDDYILTKCIGHHSNLILSLFFNGIVFLNFGKLHETFKLINGDDIEILIEKFKFSLELGLPLSKAQCFNFFVLLVMTDQAQQANQLLTTGLAKISSDEATAILTCCDFSSMADPLAIYELLEKLGAQM